MAKVRSLLFEKKVRNQAQRNREIKYDYDFLVVEVIQYEMCPILRKIKKYFLSQISKDRICLLSPKGFKWKGDTKFYPFNLRSEFSHYCYVFILPIELVGQIERTIIVEQYKYEPYTIVIDLNMGIMKFFSSILLRNKLYFTGATYKEVSSFFKGFNRSLSGKSYWCFTNLTSVIKVPIMVFFSRISMKNVDFRAYDAVFSSEESKYQNPYQMGQNNPGIKIPGYIIWSWQNLFNKNNEKQEPPICICPACRTKYLGFVVRIFNHDHEIDLMDPIRA